MSDWDPIGVSDEPAAAGQYDAYADPLGGQLRNGATAEELAHYLGVRQNPADGSVAAATAHRAAAQKIVDWYAAEMMRTGR
jgi:hypothetical protein